MSQSDTSQSEVLRCFTCGKTYLDMATKKCPSCGTPSKGAARVEAGQQSESLLIHTPEDTASPFERRLLAEMEKQTKFIKAGTWGVFAIWLLAFITYLMGFKIILPGG